MFSALPITARQTLSQNDITRQLPGGLTVGEGSGMMMMMIHCENNRYKV
jgi:hypothetical protein